MLIQRAIITFTLGPLALYLIYLGGPFYFIPVVALLTLATIEYSQLIKKLTWQAPLWILLPAVYVQWLLPEEIQAVLLGGPWIDGGTSLDITFIGLLVGLFVAMFFALWLYERRPQENAPAAWLALSTGIILIGWLGSHFFRVRSLPEAAVQWTALAMLGTWFADSGAYVFGKWLGRHRLSPRLSPNKTVEGYVGGIAVGILSTVLIALFLELPLGLALLLGVLVSTVSPAGDLAISLLKREAGVKDSGHFLPGHGGALDRIDSLVWSVAIAYYLVLLAA